MLQFWQYSSENLIEYDLATDGIEKNLAVRMRLKVLNKSE
jgi:hypothetical protein